MTKPSRREILGGAGVVLATGTTGASILTDAEEEVSPGLSWIFPSNSLKPEEVSIPGGRYGNLRSRQDFLEETQSLADANRRNWRRLRRIRNVENDWKGSRNPFRRKEAGKSIYLDPMDPETYVNSAESHGGLFSENIAISATDNQALEYDVDSNGETEEYVGVSPEGYQSIPSFKQLYAEARDMPASVSDTAVVDDIVSGSAVGLDSFGITDDIREAILEELSAENTDDVEDGMLDARIYSRGDDRRARQQTGQISDILDEAADELEEFVRGEEGSPGPGQAKVLSEELYWRIREAPVARAAGGWFRDTDSQPRNKLWESERDDILYTDRMVDNHELRGLDHDQDSINDSRYEGLEGLYDQSQDILTTSLAEYTKAKVASVAMNHLEKEYFGGRS